jgi:hypothetical protein
MWTLRRLVEDCNSCQAEINGKWVPARPINYKYRTLKEKFREAYAVFTGKADCFTWPEGQ